MTDTREAVHKALQKAVRDQVDVIISSAGVSVGSYDYVRDVIESEGELEFWRIDMRPGKPLVFGSYAEIPFFGLRGNPASALVTYTVLVIPMIDRLRGL
jgi:molybdopterin molybdotransferase